MTLLGTDLPKQLEWLALASRWTLGGLLAKAGSARPGEGAGWSHDRDYAPGDDYRSIDWRVCARHDELVSRCLPANSDRCVYVFVDCSRSMSTGRPPKFDVARRTAALLGAAALGHSDQLAVLAFAGRIVAELPPIRGSARLLKMLRFLDGLTPDGAPTDLARAAECLVRRRQRPGLAVVIGDFFAPESYRRGLEILRHHWHLPCVVHVCDREDAEPDLLGDVELYDVETGYRWNTVLGRRDLARYRELYEEFCGSVRRFCRQHAIGHLRVREDTSWERIVFELTGVVGKDEART
jgi:uncharacterized protein (DUF58 family)